MTKKSSTLEIAGYDPTMVPHWIGLIESLQEILLFHGKNDGFL